MRDLNVKKLHALEVCLGRGTRSPTNDQGLQDFTNEANVQASSFRSMAGLELYPLYTQRQQSGTTNRYCCNQKCQHLLPGVNAKGN